MITERKETQKHGSKEKLTHICRTEKLEDELHDLKVVKRKEVAEKIKEAREQGDLSENAEYDAAKDEQRDIELRIEEIEKILKMQKLLWKMKLTKARSTLAAK